MAAVVTQRLLFSTTTNVASYGTGSFTPATGDVLVVVAIPVGITATSVTFTSSVSGLTFDAYNSGASVASVSTNTAHAYVFVSSTALTSGQAVSQTVTLANSTSWTGCYMEIYSVSGLTKAGLAALVQVVGVSAGTSGAAPAVTMGSTVHTGNPVSLSLFNTSGATMTLPSGFSTLHTATSFSNPASDFGSASLNSGSTASSYTYGSTSGSTWGLVAIEIDASSVTDTPLTPTVGAVALASAAPTVTVSTNAKALAFTAAQAQVYAAALSSAKHLTATSAEVEAQAAQLTRSRALVANAVAEAEAVAVTLDVASTSKLLSFSLNEAEATTVALREQKNFVVAVAEAQSYTAALKVPKVTTLNVYDGTVAAAPTATVSSAFTPVAGDLLVVWLTTGSNTTTGTLTSSVAGQSFTLVNDAECVNESSVAEWQFVYVASALATAVSQTISFVPVGSTPTNLIISVTRLSDAPAAGMRAVRQFTGQNGDDAPETAPSIAFAAPCLASSVIMAAVRTSSITATAPSGFTTGTSTLFGTGPRYTEYHQVGGFTGTALTWGDVGTSSNSTLVIEVVSSNPASFITAIPEAEAISPAVELARSFAAASSEAEAYAVVAKRARALAEAVSETEVIASTLQSAKALSFSSSEAEAVAAALSVQGVAKTFSFSSSEAETFTAALSEVKQLSVALSEAETFTAALSEVKQLSVALSEAEAITPALTVAGALKSLSYAISEAETHTAALQRSRTVAATVSEAEVVAVAVARAKQLTATIAEAETQTTALTTGLAVSYVSSTVGVELVQPSSTLANDVVIAWAFSSSATQPTLPSGWTQVARVDTNGCHQLLAYYIAVSSSQISATFTNAQLTAVSVYRGCNTTSPIGAFATNSGTSTTIGYPALALHRTDGSSWTAIFAGTSALDSTIETAPTGFTFRTGFNRSATYNADVAMFDEQNTFSYAGESISIGGASDGWQAAAIELMRPAGLVSIHVPVPEAESVAATAVLARSLATSVPELESHVAALDVLRPVQLSAVIAETESYAFDLTVGTPVLNQLSAAITEAEAHSFALKKLARVTGTANIYASTSPANSQVSNSFQPAANELLVVWVAVSGRFGAPTLTSSVAGQAFTFIGTSSASSYPAEQHCFVSTALSTAVLQTVTFNNGLTSGSPPTGLIVNLARVANLSRLGSLAVRSFAKRENGAAGATPAVTMQLPLTTNALIGSVLNDTNDVAGPTNWVNDVQGVSNANLVTYHRDSGASSGAISWSATSTSAWSAAVIELDTSDYIVKDVGFTAAETSVNAPAIITARSLIAPVPEVQLISPSVSRSMFLAPGALSEAQAYSFPLIVGAPKTFAATLAETEAIALSIARYLTTSTTVVETSSLAVSVGALRRLAAALVEATSYFIDISPSFQKYLSAAISEVEGHSFGAMRRIRGLANVISEVTTSATTVVRNRGEVTAILSQGGLTSALGIVRSVTTSLTELEATLTKVSRQRDVQATVAELEAAAAALDKLRLMTPMPLSEVEAINAAAGLTRSLVTSVPEAEALTGHVTMARSFVATVPETETLTAALARVRNVIVALAEVEAMAPALALRRGVTVAVAELETATAALSRIASLAATLSEVEAQAYVVGRVRGISSDLAEVEAFTAAFGRAREFITGIAEAEVIAGRIGVNHGLSAQLNEATTHTLDINRMLSVVAPIAEAEGWDAAVSRTRSIVQDVATTLGYSFNVSFSSDAGSPSIITIEWVDPETNMSYVKTVKMGVKFQQGVAAPISYTSTVIVPDESL